MKESFDSEDQNNQDLAISFVDMQKKIELYAERQAVEEFEKEMEAERKKSAWNLGKYVNRFIKRNGRTAIIEEKKNRIIKEIRENKYLESQITSDSNEVHTELKNEVEYFHERTREDLFFDENEIQNITSAEITLKISNLLQDVLKGDVALDSADFDLRQADILQDIKASLNINTEDLSTDLKDQFRQWVTLHSNLSNVELENLKLKLKLGVFNNVDINTKEKDRTFVNKWIKKVINFTQKHRPLGHIINPTTLAVGAATLMAGGKLFSNLALPVVGGLMTGSAFASARAVAEADHSRTAILRRQALNYDSTPEKRPIEEKFEKANYEIEKSEILLNNLNLANDPESVKQAITEILAREEVGQENQIDLISYSSGASIQKELGSIIKLIKEKGAIHLGTNSIKEIKQIIEENKETKKKELLEMVGNKDSIYTREKIKKVLIDTSIFAGVGGAVSGVGRLLSEFGVFGTVGESIKKVWGELKEASGYKTASNVKLKLPENFPYEDKQYSDTLEKSFVKEETSQEIISVDKSKLPEDWKVDTKVVQEQIYEKKVPGTGSPTEIPGHKRIEGVRDFWYDNKTPGVIDGNELRLHWSKGPSNNLVVDVSSMLGKTASSLNGNLEINSDAFVSGKIKLLVTPLMGDSGNPIAFDIDANGQVIIDLKDEVNKQLYEISQDGRITFNGAYTEIAEVKDAAGKNLIRPIATVVGNNSLTEIKVPDVIEKVTIPEQKYISVIPGSLEGAGGEHFWFPPISGNRYENLGFKPSSTLTPEQIKELKKKKQEEEKQKVSEEVNKLDSSDQEHTKMAKENIIEILQGEFPFEVEKNLKIEDVKYDQESAKKAIELKHVNSDFIDEIMDQAKQELEFTKDVTKENLENKIKEIHDKLYALWEKALKKQEGLISELKQSKFKDLYFLQLLVEIKNLELLLNLLHLQKKGLINWGMLKKQEFLEQSNSNEIAEFDQIIKEINSLVKKIKQTDESFSDDLFGAINQAGDKKKIKEKIDDLEKVKKEKDPYKEFQHYLEEDTYFELNDGKVIFFEQNKNYNSLNPFKYIVFIDDQNVNGKVPINKEITIPENASIYPWISASDQKMKINFFAKTDDYSNDVLIKDLQGVELYLDNENDLADLSGKKLVEILKEASEKAAQINQEQDDKKKENEAVIKESFGSTLSKEEIYQYFKNSVFEYWEKLISEKNYQNIAAIISKMNQNDQAKLKQFFGVDPQDIINNLNDEKTQENTANNLLEKILKIKDAIKNIATANIKEHPEASTIISEMAAKIMEIKAQSKPGKFGQVIKFDGEEVEHNEMQIFRQRQGNKDITVAQFHLNENTAKAVSSYIIGSGAGSLSSSFRYHSKNNLASDIIISHKMYEIALHSSSKDQLKIMVSCDDSNRALRGIVKIEIPDELQNKEINEMILKVFQILNLGNTLHAVKEEDNEKYLAQLKDLKYNQDSMSSKQISQIMINPEHITLKEENKLVQELEDLGLKAIYHQFHTNHFETMIDSGHLLSTHERWTHGLFEGGMSSNKDLQTGGAKSVFTRIMTKNSFQNKNLYDSGKPLVVLDNSLFARMDVYSYPADKYGDLDKYVYEQRLSPKKLVQSLNTNYGTNNEQMFNDSISLKDFCKNIVCSDQLERAKFINIMKNKGYTNFGSENKPIEEVVITRGQFWNNN